MTLLQDDARIRDLPFLVVKFIQNPLETMRSPSRLSWPATFTLQIVAAMVSGSIVGLIAHSWLDFLVGLFVFPLVTVMVAAIFTLFIYYFFILVTSTYLDIRRVHSIVVFSTVPYFLLHSLAGFLAPLDLIGFAFTSILLTVGLVEQFGLRRQTVATLIVALFFVFFIAWSAVQYYNS